MTLFQILAVLLSMTALFGFINYHFLKLPTMIGVMVVALLLSSAIIALQYVGVDLRPWAEHVVGRIDFNQTLLHGMLSFLLFAGALHVDLGDLDEEKWPILLLATFGVVLSTVLVGSMTALVLRAVGVELSFTYCLLFGAVISPTDPVAVLGILRKARAPKRLETLITGESLFNDGVGVVVFLVILGIATGTGHGSGVQHAALLFAEEAIGGVVFGLALGGLAYTLLKTVDDYQVEIIISLGIVTGGYALASAIHTSGPIAIVVAGLLVGNHGRRFAMSARTRDNLDTFWELVDEILNAVLFLLIGLELLVVDLEWRPLLAGALAIPVVLLSRLIAVAGPLALLRKGRTFEQGTVRVMTWGGLRGGISVALALSVPMGPERDLLLAITYPVVLFSILVQGLTVERAVRRWVPAHLRDVESPPS